MAAMNFKTRADFASDCEFWHYMDKHYGTPQASPIHHDNRCNDH